MGLPRLDHNNNLTDPHRRRRVGAIRRRPFRPKKGEPLFTSKKRVATADSVVDPSSIPGRLADDLYGTFVAAAHRGDSKDDLLPLIPQFVWMSANFGWTFEVFNEALKELVRWRRATVVSRGGGLWIRIPEFRPAQ